MWEESIRAHIIKVQPFRPFEVYARADREPGDEVLNAVKVSPVTGQLSVPSKGPLTSAPCCNHARSVWRPLGQTRSGHGRAP